MAKNRIESAINKIDLAFRANGGEEFRPDRCSCEPEVGFVPCEYCAIRDGLLVGKKALESVIAYREAILNCIGYANNRESECGDRARNAFQFLYDTIEEA